MFKLIKLLLVIVVIAVAGVMFLPLGSVEYTDPNLTAPLVVPSFSMFEGEDGEPGSIAMHTVTGHTIIVATMSFFGISAFWNSATAMGYREKAMINVPIPP